MNLDFVVEFYRSCRFLRVVSGGTGINGSIVFHLDITLSWGGDTTGTGDVWMENHKVDCLLNRRNFAPYWSLIELGYPGK